MSNIEKKIEDLGFRLPEVAVPVARYLPYSVSGKRIIVSGQISKSEDGGLITGALGADCDLEKGIFAAQRSALYIIAALKDACDGDLTKIKKINKIGGYVNSTADFKDQPQVINGASDLFVEVFGEEVGMHARAAVGVRSLPLGVAVEIEAEAEMI